jgi:putative serine protease PepD
MFEVSPDDSTTMITTAERPSIPAGQHWSVLPPPAPNPRSSGTGRAALAGGIVGALVAAAVALIVVRLDHNTGSGSTKTSSEVIAGSKAPTDSPVSAPSSRIAGVSLDIAALLAKAKPSVVSIDVNQNGGALGSGKVGAGSGVVVTADGLVLTNDHVADPSLETGSGSTATTTYKVHLSDGRSFDATLVGSSATDDLALLQLKGASNLTPATLGDSDALRVGDDVVAVGNALDLQGDLTVTRGIVSAKNRPVNEPSGITIEHLLQTDAAINPGNSGGALVNAAGEVVGIPTAISSQGQNIGYAISSNRAKLLIPDLKKGGAQNPNAARLGVGADPVSQLTDGQRQQLGITDPSGVVITSLTRGGAAAKAGLQTGDVITKVDATEISSQGDLSLAVRSHNPGDIVTVTYVRNGSTKTVKATLQTATPAS